MALITMAATSAGPEKSPSAIPSLKPSAIGMPTSLQVFGVRRDARRFHRQRFRPRRHEPERLFRRRQLRLLQGCLIDGHLDERQRDFRRTLCRRCSPSRSQRKVLTMRNAIALMCLLCVPLVCSSAMRTTANWTGSGKPFVNRRSKHARFKISSGAANETRRDRAR